MIRMLESPMAAIVALSAVLLWGPPVHSQDVQSTTERVPTGLIFLSPSTYASIPEASSPAMGLLPKATDLTSQFPPPGDQGTQNSCVAWAVAYGVKTYLEGSERHWPISTSDHVFSPSFLYNQLNHKADCSGGLKFDDVLNLIHAGGVSSLQDFPYDPSTCSTLPNAAIRQSAAVFKIGEYRRVNVQDDTEVKSQIVSGIPVIVGITADYDFWKLYRGDRGKGIYTHQPLGKPVGGHALVLIGYDDSKNAYKVLNSWGQSWGDQGYGWIDYDTFHEMVQEGFVIQDAPSYGSTQQGPGSNGNPNALPFIPNQPGVQVGIPAITFNVQVQPPAGGGPFPMPGLMIVVPGQIVNSVGRHVQLVARFTGPNGQPLVANPQEHFYRDVAGLVATGTPDITVGQASVNLAPFYFLIPYYALNLMPTNGQANYQLFVTVSVYVDSFIVFQTAPQGFVVRY